MKKLFPYTIIALFITSSTYGMLAITQGVSIQKAYPDYLNSTDICQKAENPLNQIEAFRNYISDLFPNGIPSIDHTIGIQKDSQACLQIKKIDRALDKLEKKIMQALGRPANESQKIYDKVYKIIDELNKEKIKLETLDSVKPINECSDIQNKKRIFAISFLYDIIGYTETNSKNLNPYYSLDYLRYRLINSARQEMTKYGIQKKILKEDTYFRKIYKHTLNLVGLTNDFKAIKYNANWYENLGRNIDLSNSNIDSDIQVDKTQQKMFRIS